jgi:hypothetical protein
MKPRELPRPYVSILMALYEADGAGVLDQHGRVHAAKTNDIIIGDTHAWLRLVALGLVAGEDNKLLLTQAGRDLAAVFEAGRVREA